MAGSNKAVLAQVPQDRVKQATLGGAVLTTAALAVFSCAVALHMTLHAPIALAIAGGLVWGVMILNLDRWLVVSTVRQSRPVWTVLMSLPRLVLALIIGLVVSTPLTLAVFGGEIDARLQTTHTQALADFEQRLQSDPRFVDLPDQQARIVALQQDIATASPQSVIEADPQVVRLQQQLEQTEADFNAAEQAVACEKEGTCGSGRAGTGPAAADKEARRDRLAAQRVDLTAQLAAAKQALASTAAQQVAAVVADKSAQLQDLQATVERAEGDRAAAVVANQTAVAGDDGLLARLEALHDLEDDSATMRAAHLLLFLFLTALECLPVFFKTILLLARPSSYEVLSAARDEQVQKRAQLLASTSYQEAEVQAQAALDAVRARAATQLTAEVRAARVVLEAQVELAGEAVAQWKKAQSEVLAEQMRRQVAEQMRRQVDEQVAAQAAEEVAAQATTSATDQTGTQPGAQTSAQTTNDWTQPWAADQTASFAAAESPAAPNGDSPATGFSDGLAADVAAGGADGFAGGSSVDRILDLRKTPASAHPGPAWTGSPAWTESHSQDPDAAVETAQADDTMPLPLQHRPSTRQ
ncbi:DUF4407 domain-containing protein [Kineococcus sp. SYSU DK002]|uniref:DUF4407 domain-containing protein n=1 Tax=Kineococcus sp. SYSU DK002 TaxID=3383123 RepID=UPI003D7E3FF7